MEEYLARPRAAAPAVEDPATAWAAEALTAAVEAAEEAGVGAEAVDEALGRDGGYYSNLVS